MGLNDFKDPRCKDGENAEVRRSVLHSSRDTNKIEIFMALETPRKNLGGKMFLKFYYGFSVRVPAAGSDSDGAGLSDSP